MNRFISPASICLIAGRTRAIRCAMQSAFCRCEEHHIVEALTTDRHFEQEGFVRLLKT